MVAKVSGSGYYKGVCRAREHVKHAIGSNKLERVQVFYILIVMVDMFMLLFYVEDMAWLHSIIRPRLNDRAISMSKRKQAVHGNLLIGMYQVNFMYSPCNKVGMQFL